MKGYRAGVGIALFNKQGRVWCGKRNPALIHTPKTPQGGTQGNARGLWQMPQGGIDAGEDPLDAAFRELFEETGITQDKVRLASQTHWLVYSLPPEMKRHVWGGQYLGQRQKWFAMHFLGDDSHVWLNTQNPPEFVAWEWQHFETTPQTVISFKQDLYHQLVSAFLPIVKEITQESV